MHWRWTGVGSSLAMSSLFVSGCSSRSAPTLGLFGAYFPAWIACALIGVAAATFTRMLLVRGRLSRIVPVRMLACCAIGLIAACLAWLWLER